MLEYWFSMAADRWLVAAKADGALIAQFDTREEITDHFMPEIVSHLEKQCEFDPKHIRIIVRKGQGDYLVAQEYVGDKLNRMAGGFLSEEAARRAVCLVPKEG